MNCKMFVGSCMELGGVYSLISLVSLPFLNFLGSDLGNELPSKDRPFLSTITENKRLTTEDHFQDVRLITFDITGSGMR